MPVPVFKRDNTSDAIRAGKGAGRFFVIVVFVQEFIQRGKNDYLPSRPPVALLKSDFTIT